LKARSVPLLPGDIIVTGRRAGYAENKRKNFKGTYREQEKRRRTVKKYVIDSFAM